MLAGTRSSGDVTRRRHLICGRRACHLAAIPVGVGVSVGVVVLDNGRPDAQIRRVRQLGTESWQIFQPSAPTPPTPPPPHLAVSQVANTLD